ncbi:hypothetical protein Ddye_009701 [Dipteronia dyeriana]|uniref:Protein kinase domain-containing protein n=1 Tax=Dipteronia dyeriana TaxID=168575 RepID=A0AAE0CMM0_9ROSI|nr:hypothetical protein Ddye_009701 [Dipteronia dyeriana]
MRWRKRDMGYVIVTYTTLIDEYGKIGNIEEAKRLFEGMEKRGVKPNIVTYNVLIDRYGKKRKLKEAKRLFKKMENIGVRPDTIAYNTLIDGISIGGWTKFPSFTSTTLSSSSSAFYQLSNVAGMWLLEIVLSVGPIRFIPRAENQLAHNLLLQPYLLEEIGVRHDLCLGLAGTLGYVALEYIRTGRASKESDVYSLGVVLEMVTGRNSSDRVERSSQMGTVE